MFEKILAEQAYFLLDIKGQRFFETTNESNARAAAFLLFESIIGVLMILGMFYNAENTYAALANVTALATLNQALTKGVALLVNKNEFRKEIRFLKNFWSIDKFGNTSRNELIKYKHFIEKVLRIYRILLIITANLYMLRPLLEGKRALPMICYNFCNIQGNICYISHFVLLYASLASQLITLVAFDSLFFVLLMCADSEVEQIKYGFRNLKLESVSGKKNRKRILQETAILIEHHNSVLNYINKFNKLFQTTVLSQFGATILSLCSGLFILTITGFPPSPGEFLRSVPYIAAASFQILIYCVVGERIAVQTESLSDVVYRINWTEENRPEFRKTFLLVMQRAQKRSQLSAGVWFLNMSTFVSIIRGSMSMLAFMQFLYHRKQLV